jgi:hypothetical protein
VAPVRAIADAGSNSPTNALVGSALCDLRTNPVPIKRTVKSVSRTFVYCIDGTFCVVAINEIKCCAAPCALENADENNVADADADACAERR